MLSHFPFKFSSSCQNFKSLILILSATHGVGFSPSTGCDRGSLRGVWPAWMEESNQDPGGSCSSRPTRWVQGGKAAYQLTDDNRATTSMRVNKTASLPVVQVKVFLVRCSWEGWQPSHEERNVEFLNLDSKPSAMYWVENELFVCLYCFENQK